MCLLRYNKSLWDFTSFCLRLLAAEPLKMKYGADGKMYESNLNREDSRHILSIIDRKELNCISS